MCSLVPRARWAATETRREETMIEDLSVPDACMSVGIWALVVYIEPVLAIPAYLSLMGVASSPASQKTVAGSKTPPAPQIWWANAIFFILVHITAVVGMYYIPPWSVKKATLLLWFLTWQLSDFGITIGYHRLYSHKAFRATLGVRVVLAILGSSAFQGSIKWWVLRHRLHHRFTDDPLHDPYSATRGLFYSHMGWIFYKQTYDRLDLIEKDDLERDGVVRFQHRHYVPLAIFFGFICPTLLASLWRDALGGFVWGGLIARLPIWHCTFLVNSLAHWDGLQPYSDENTSRGNLILALLTGGEGNHNFHSFPHDFRSGPSLIDWDPSKWIIVGLQKLGVATALRRVRDEDLKEALRYMHMKETLGIVEPEDHSWNGYIWTPNQAKEFAMTGRCVILLDGFVVDATPYLGEHPGGSNILRKYSLQLGNGTDHETWKNADWAFNGGMNTHSRAARKRMREFRVARLAD